MNEAIPGWVATLPSVNAGLNTVATLLLVAGGLAIRRENRVLHQRLMVSAFAVSVAFLGCYLAYHFGLQAATGSSSKPYAGPESLRIVYYVILATHVPLAAFVPLLVVPAIWFAAKGRYETHKKITRWAYPIWLYVSVTGVVIYAMLYHLAAAA